ncbi:acylphosphatase [Marilutibacter maris]|uniref:Acylphosphatase n=1 Tax=Marilutibacter maris TaxID=1605891 RepID=A0A2U9TA44_9GAMM|nr:acylphosphatase [Lysobacter maris]AWV08057.1 acylphosphatase [Lysobacter maris]KAB8198826.1 acylphosphatase [Lysobacter maris]
MAAARFWISGKVQGVWFRASTCERAQELGLRGYARNLADGRVEVLAAGDADALDSLDAWLQHGPPQARVASVRREAAGEDESGPGFTVG